MDLELENITESLQSDTESDIVENNSDEELNHDNGAEDSDAQDEGRGDDVEFPKKAVNALARKTKQIHKLHAKLRELEDQLKKTSEVTEKPKEINPDDFDNYGDYINAQVNALVEAQLQQSQKDLHKTQLTHQQESLKTQRNQYILEQAQEVSKVLPDLPKLWQQNAQTLDSLPEQITDIFYSLENAPAAIYTLAKEGKLESLQYASPFVAAYEIINAEKRGLEILSKPQSRVSQAPSPISKAKGTGSMSKQLSPNDDVLKSLGLKR